MNKILLTLITFFFISHSEAQHRLAYLSYVFPSDSLSGFNESTASKEALSRGFFGKEFKVFMYRAKRNYINDKYGFSNNTVFKQELPTIAGAPCVNEDFEASPASSVSVLSVSGWTLSQGQNTASCTMGGCCLGPLTANNVWIRSTPYVAPAPVMNVPNSPLGGSKVIQLNDNVVSAGEVVRMRQTFPVTATNALFQYAYIAVMNGSGHACCDQPYLNIKFFDCLNNTIACGSTSISAPGAACPTSTVGWVTNTSGVSYSSGWQVQAIDLSSFIGSCVTIQVTVGDCDGWAHEGYCFFDAKCSPLNITANSNSFPPTGTINACGPVVNLTAPAGYSPYLWNGPIGTNTNSVINTTVSGSYSLTMGTGLCSSVKVFSLNVIPAPATSLTATSSTACANGNTIALNGSPAGGVYSGTGVTGNVFVPPSAPGNYLITYMYTSPTTSCTNTSNFVINVNVCMGIESMDIKSGSVKIYPNPSNGEFRIDGNSEDLVIVTNELGQVLREIKLNAANNYSCIISNLPGGIYFATGKNFKEKIVVIK